MTDFLYIQLVQGLRGQLKGNRIAAVLLDLVRSGSLFNSSRSDNTAALIESTPSDESKNPGQIPPSPGYQDMRMRHLAVCNIKKYPGSIADNMFYGIKFSGDNDNPVNSVFIGANGVGKTSLYAALEYAGMRKMNSASVRGYRRKIGQSGNVGSKLEMDQAEFMVHSGADIKDASIRFISNSSVFKLDGEDLEGMSGIPLVPETFYCSDFDVRQLESDDDYTEFILRQIGLSHYYKCLQDLYYVGSYLNDTDKSIENHQYDNEKPSYDEVKYRMLIGIAENQVNINDDYFERNEVIEHLMASLMTANSAEVSIRIASELKNVLIKELRKIPKAGWHTIEIERKYENCIVLLSKIRNLLRKTIKSDISPIIEKLGKFVDFRNELLHRIEELKIQVTTASSRQRIQIINGYYELYAHSINCSIHKQLKERENSYPFADERIYEKFIGEYYDLVTYLESNLKNIVESWFPKIKESVIEILAEYFHIDNDRLDMTLETSSFIDVLISKNAPKSYDHIQGLVHPFLNIDINVMTARGNRTGDTRYPISPRAYLNTFRFKLFCVALKLALCCFVKDTQNLNFPLVIDDVFDSSDFDSRLKLKDFVESMVEQHNRILTEDRFRLQLIFFTQDDLIADQVYKGLKTATGDARLLRIYDYHDAEDRDRKEITVQDQTYTYTSVADRIC